VPLWSWLFVIGAGILDVVRDSLVEEAWGMLDRAALAAVAAAAGRVFFASVSGAHLYGFASPDSDVDLRGAFVLPLDALIGLMPPRETISVMRDEAGVELDWVAHDLRKFAAMMIRHNGYVLEQLFSPLVATAAPELEELRSLGRGCITRGLYKHYRGFARGRRKLLDAPSATVKTLLYAYRVYLTGIHVLDSGVLEANLVELNDVFRLGVVDELIARKRAGAEKGKLEPGEAAMHEAELDRLEARLHAAYAASKLPEEATTIHELDRFVVRVRLAGRAT
jgi:predicted nucleotidyltransferase